MELPTTNGHTELSTCQSTAAGTANAATPTSMATAVAASGSRARASSIFQTACPTAAMSARTRAVVGTGVVFRADGTPRRRLRLQRHALSRRADPLRDLHGPLRGAGRA